MVGGTGDVAGLTDTTLDGVGGTEVLVAKGQVGIEALAERKIEVKTMGRTPEQDPEFFLAAGAAGVIAATRMSGE